ncbi:MAG: sulfate ABC transporter substrate-binding protein [Acidimicrobiales bacterium]
MRTRSTTVLAVLVSLTGLAACGSDKDSTASSSTAAGEGAGAVAALPAAELTLVAYSTPQEAYDQITEAFSRTPQGRNITFTRSYGGSGDQSRAVESGLTADVVAFALEPDMTRLVKKGLVAEDWSAGEHKGMVTESLTVFVVKKGNPKNIKTWADLVKRGVEVITPNPFTSGGARWNVMAAYGQASDGGKVEADGVSYLDRLFANVPVQDDSARKSLQTFTSGKGDVLLAYENEAIFAQQKDQAIDYVVPDDTILIENPVAVTSSSKYPEQAKAFVEFLQGKQAQEIFAKNGYRPVLDGVESPYDFPEPAGLFDIATFGGWADVSEKFFDPAGSVMADVERKIGVSVG